ncbi:MAG: hypothetical protein MMC33_008709 [Icmadophila ericetorum]|nr:hypothetical protein [Icmadophila ericetorum]
MSDPPSVSLSFANNFWGKEDAGVQPLLERMHNAKVTCDELKTFYNGRAAVEEEYARKLLAICRKPLGSCESGSLRASLDVMRGEVESIGKAHQTIAAQMKSELEEPLAAFAGGMKERRKIVQTGTEKLLKVKVQQTQTVNKTRDRYEQDCLRIKGYLAQGHMVMGQEERKNKAKLEKTQIQLASTSNEYEAAIKALEETTGRWNRDWKAACDKFQDLEEERLDFTKSSLWTFANIASTVCVSDDASYEKIRLSLESCEVEKDISQFIQERGTGQEISDPPKYINFCRGDVNDTASEASEDEAYSVAQFPRTINPAFRTSSPQPSTFESHHDPQSELAKRMAQQNPNTPPSRETTLTPQKAAQQPPPSFDCRRQAQAQAQIQHNQSIDLPQVPHNEYPTDGMTMFCRTDNSSNISGQSSNHRPSSRDSQSDYSNPTSLSSIEPASGAASPTKQEPEPQQMSPTKQLQKRRSGFFSNSPFRRKSKHDKDGRDGSSAMTSPISRNTGISSGGYGNSNNPSPVRGGIASRDFATGSHSPEPVDPRANFQLNVGPNVFDVASPDTRRKPQALNVQNDELDPIAQALAELKGVTKQSSVRMSADRYHGIATPAPGTPGVQLQNGALTAAHRGTPPPSYTDPQSVKRLDLPKPAFTSAQMQQTTRKYTNQTQEMYGAAARPGSAARPGTRNGHSGEIPPRATSPLPLRSTSPRPGFQVGAQGQGQQKSFARSASPNPYNGRSRPVQGGTQSQGASPVKQAYGNPNQRVSNQFTRHASPNDIRRAASPQPNFARQERERPASSAGVAGMALQLSDGGQGQQTVPYGGSARGRNTGGSVARPMTYYGGGGNGAISGPLVDQSQGRGPSGEQRARSKTVVDGRQFTRDGRPILHFARALFAYQAVIPEELGFAKGDTLAVLALQDDGWWEAESTTNRRRGLVPSNYLQTM